MHSLIDPSASMIQQQAYLLATSTALLGVSCIWLAGIIMAIVERHRKHAAASWEFEEVRRIQLREGNPTYRCFEPLIDELTTTRVVRKLTTEKICLALGRGGDTLPWKPEEFVGTAVMQSILMFVAVAFFGSGYFASSAFIAVAGVVSGLFLCLNLSGVDKKGRDRLAQIENRLPYSVDLIALMMGAGADFERGLETVIGETPEHPLSNEFDKVLQSVNRGRVLSEALEEVNNRLSSELIRVMVFSVNKANELGTPLANMFLDLADDMRLKKSQWAETKAGEAQTNINFPGLIIMCSCLMMTVGIFAFMKGN
jgi:hypothetical protein